jgi:FixJ family two-component response regulator
MVDNRSPFVATVFVIDDDASVRKSLSRLMRSFGYEVETYPSAEHFLSRDPYDGVGCIVLDIRMPGISGMILQERLSVANNNLPIIFITGHADIQTSVQAMKRGAVDFLTKPFDDEELLQAVRRATEKDERTKAYREETRHALERIQELTPREYEILRYILGGMLNKQIAFSLGIAEKTIKVHRGHIMEKLNVSSVAELVRLAEKAGVSPIDR